VEEHYIRDGQELLELRKLAKSIVKEEDTQLQKADKLSAYVKHTITFPSPLPQDREWYHASAFESLMKWKIGNCMTYARSLIGLAYSIGIEGRKVSICGAVDGYEQTQGHVLCELKIDGKWIVFDAMYGAPFLGTHKVYLDGTEEDYTPKTPSAYECWKNPDLYRTLINPKYLAFSKKFWEQIWYDFGIVEEPRIREMGEKAFLEKWYVEA